MRAAVAELVRSQPNLWLGSGFTEARTEATGWLELDRTLPGGGWPAGVLTELYCPVEGVGEFSLLMPLIVRLTRASRRVVLVSPPHLPYSQALSEHGVKLDKLVLLSPQSGRDTLWAAEQALRCTAVGLVVAWPQRAGDRELRRLALAAEDSGALMIAYRPVREARSFSPAALRIAVRPGGTSSLELEILKSRGGPGKIGVRVGFPAQNPTLTPILTAAGRA